jgi:hypothetical protein
VADQIMLQNRQRKLPEALRRSEQEVSYLELAVADAKQSLVERQKHHEAELQKLEALRKERETGESELAEIAAELRKLADVV